MFRESLTASTMSRLLKSGLVHRQKSRWPRAFICLLLIVGCLAPVSYAEDVSQPIVEEWSIAREWNEALLAAIRLDTARPTVHARNLFHLSAVMWDAWAAYQAQAKQLFYAQKINWQPQTLNQLQAVSISIAAHTLLNWRFRNSLNYERIQLQFDQTLAAAGRRYHFDVGQVAQENQDLTKAYKLGLTIARKMIDIGLQDGSNEKNDYLSKHYLPVNPPVNPNLTGNPAMIDADRWQPLELPGFVGQSGIRSDGYPPFVGPEWGEVQPFSLSSADASIKRRNGKQYRVYLDSGAPPSLQGDAAEQQGYVQTFTSVIRASRALDANNGERFDNSPGARGNRTLGETTGPGHQLNPVNGLPYAPNQVVAADFYRVLAEFWADGPNSETPPGHWLVIFNMVSDQPGIKNQIGKSLRAETRLEWDLQGYLAMGGAMHDAAIAAWSHKGWYDYARPISAIRKLCEYGQSSDSHSPSYHEKGIKLELGLVEMITPESSSEGGIHQHLLAQEQNNVGRIAINAWRGPLKVNRTSLAPAGVGWILCGDWWPYQRHNFVTPPFAGYVSGHSTFSRAAAEVISMLTGSQYFPGGLGVFTIPANDFLVFEPGPSESLQLQWATYQDAADDSAISRVYGGIHPPADDMPGRLLGFKIGTRAFAKAQEYFRPIK